MLEELGEVVGALFEAKGLLGEFARTLQQVVGLAAEGVDGFFGLGTPGILWHGYEYAQGARKRSAKIQEPNMSRSKKRGSKRMSASGAGKQRGLSDSLREEAERRLVLAEEVAEDHLAADGGDLRDGGAAALG